MRGVKWDGSGVVLGGAEACKWCKRVMNVGKKGMRVAWGMWCAVCDMCCAVCGVRCVVCGT